MEARYADGFEFAKQALKPHAMNPVNQDYFVQHADAHTWRERTLRALIRLGLGKAVGLITVLAVIGSLSVTFGFHSYLIRHGSRLSNVSWLISSVTPLLVAPTVSFFFVYLLQELDKARQAAHTLAVQDYLTGLYNRRYFMAHADIEFAKAQRYRTPLSVLALDADHFKAINDTYGHPAGDQVLVAIGQVMQSCVRALDLPARSGGEEFMVLLPMTDAASAMAMAERIREEMASKVITHEQQTVRVTLSVGVASLTPSTTSMDELLTQCDKALYSAKAAGRNCCKLWMEGVVNSAPA